MLNLTPIAHRRLCPKCEQNTMKISMLKATAGRTGFICDSCIECGYVRNYTMDAPRPWWHFPVIGLIPVLIMGLLFWRFG